MVPSVMYPVSNDFLFQIGQDHQIRSVAEVWPAGYFPRLPGESGSIETLPIFGGTVRNDATAVNRRRVTLKVLIEEFQESGLNLIPVDGRADLAPISNEIHVWRGVQLRTGLYEYAKLGVFRITVVVVWDSGDSIWMEIEGLDRSWTAQQRKFVDPFTIANGTEVSEAIQAVIGSAIPWTQFNIQPTGFDTPQLDYEEGSDRWKCARDLADFIGMQLFYDYNGVLNLTARKNIKTLQNPTWKYEEGEDSTLLQVVRRFDGKDVFSRITVVGRPVGQGDPFRADATDDDPNSPTFSQGAFGDVPMYVKSGFVLNQGQAQAMADTMLVDGQGLTEDIQIQAIPNPAQDVDDVVSFKRDRANINSEAAYLVNNLTLSLSTGDAMYLGATRQF